MGTEGEVDREKKNENCEETMSKRTGKIARVGVWRMR